MATKPPRPCRQRGCVALVRSASGLCAVHERAANAAKNARRGSGWVWGAMRARVLAEEPCCRLCDAPSTDIDHIIPIANGGTSDRANLQALCHACHVVKSTRENAARLAATR